jgi:hypothetical protein
MFADLANPFGATAFEPVATPKTTVYYKTMRLGGRPARRPAPKPLSQIVTTFLLTYDK